VRVDDGEVFVELPPADHHETHAPCTEAAACAAEAMA
jgi:hypothetical protein